MSDVVVIGAGLAGLSTACRLSRTGHRVTVLESGPQVGGVAGRVEQDGFAFETGPTVLTLPGLIDDTLRAAGSSVAEALPMRRLDPAYRAHFADGSTLDVLADHAAMRDQIGAACGAADAAAFDRFVDWLRRLDRVEVPNFIDRNFDSVAGLATRPGPALTLARMGAFGRLGPLVRRRFRDDRLHRLFTFQALYAGLAPARALGVYAVITYMDSIEGVYYPDGGIHAVPRALADAARSAGVDIRTDSPVERLIRGSDGAVCAVEAGGVRHPADAVVATGDLPRTYATLLPDLPVPKALRRPDFAPSAVVWHVGVRGVAPDRFAHHNIHFGHDWDDAFADLLDRRTLMRDPSRLVTVPSRTDPGRAPEGCSTYYVLEPVPNTTAPIDWPARREAMRERLHGFLRESGYPADVLSERLVTPQDWSDGGMSAGTPFSLAHTFAQTGPFRPPNVERRVPGLFFAGAGTTPGVGVPMVVISGRLAAERVLRHLPAPGRSGS